VGYAGYGPVPCLRPSQQHKNTRLTFFKNTVIIVQMQTINHLNETVKQDRVLGMLSPAELSQHSNAALGRLALAVTERNSTGGTVNYSRTHHRHARSHTRR
jgi:hypothetical protein